MSQRRNSLSQPGLSRRDSASGPERLRRDVVDKGARSSRRKGKRRSEPIEPLAVKEIRDAKKLVVDTERNFGPGISSALAKGTLAEIYVKHSQYESALSCYREIIAFYEQEGKEKSVLRTRHSVGDVYLAMGDLERALEIFQSTLASREKAFGKEDEAILESKRAIAITFARQKRYKEALETFQQVLNVMEEKSAQVGGEINSEMAALFNDMAALFRESGDLDNAMKFYTRALKTDKGFIQNPETVKVFHEMASSLSGLGRYQEASECCRRALRGYEKIFKTNRDVREAIDAECLMARINAAQQKNEAARRLFESAINRYEQVLAGSEVSLIKGIVLELARVCALLGDFTSALNHFDRVIAEMPPEELMESGGKLVCEMIAVFSQQMKGSRHAYGRDELSRVLKVFDGERLPLPVLGSLQDLAATFVASGNAEDAIFWYMKCLCGYLEVGGRDSDEVLAVFKSMTAVLISSGGDKLSDMYRKSVRLFENGCPAKIFTILCDLARQLRSLDRLSEALHYFNGVLVISEQVQPPPDTKTLVLVRMDLASTLKDSKQFDESFKQCSIAFDRLIKEFGRKDETAIKCLEIQLSLVPSLKQYEIAKEGFDRALEAFGTEFPTTVLPALQSLSEKLLKGGRQSKAFEWYDKLLTAYEKSSAIASKEHSDAILKMCAAARSLKDTERTLKWYGRAFTGYACSFPSDQADVAMDIVDAMAKLLPLAKDYQRSVILLKDCLQQLKLKFKRHPIFSLQEMAGLFFEGKQYKIALEWYSDILDIYDKSPQKGSTEHLELLRSMHTKSVNLDQHSHSDIAVKYYRRTLSGFEKMENCLADTLKVANSIGSFYLRRKEYSKAIDYFERIMHNQDKSSDDALKATRIHALKTLCTIAEARFGQKAFAEALNLYNRIVEFCDGQQEFIAVQSHVFHSLSTLGMQLKQVNIAAAIEWLETCKAGLEKANGGTHPDTIRSCLILARMYEANSSLDKAFSVLTETYALQEKECTGGPQSQMLQTLLQMGFICQEKQDLSQALALYCKGLSTFEKSLGKSSAEYAGILSAIQRTGNHLLKKGDLVVALEWYKKYVDASYNINTVLSKKGLSEILNGIVEKANSYRAVKDHDKALQCNEFVLESFKRLYGEDHKEVLRTLSRIALIHREKGDTDASLSHYEKALQKYTSLPIGSQSGIEDLLQPIAELYKKKEDAAKSLEFYIRTLEAKRVSNGHEQIMETMKNTATNYLEKGQYDDAKQWLAAVLEKDSKKTRGMTKPSRISQSCLLIIEGAVLKLKEKGNMEKAVEWLEWLISERRNAFGENSPEALKTLRLRASFHRSKGELKQALERYEQAATGFSRDRSQQTQLIQTLMEMWGIARESKDYKQGLEVLGRVLSICQKQSNKPKEFSEALEAMRQTVAEFQEAKDYSSALEWSEKLVGYLDKGGSGRITETSILMTIASLSKSLGEYQKALASYGRVVSFSEGHGGAKQKALSEALSCISSTAHELTESGKKDEARQWYRRALDYYEKKGPPSKTISTLKDMALIEKGEDSKKALNLLDRALATAERAGGMHKERIAIIDEIARFTEKFTEEKAFDDAHVWQDRILSAYQKMSNFPRVVETLVALASTAKLQGSLPKSLTYYGRALSVCEKAGGMEKEHSDVLGAVTTVAIGFQKEKDYDSAEAWLRVALSANERTKNGSGIVDTLLLLAQISKEKGNRTAALQNYDRAFQARRMIRRNSDVSEKMLESIGAISTELKEEGDLRGALDWYKKALDGYEELHGTGSKQYGETLKVVLDLHNTLNPAPTPEENSSDPPKNPPKIEPVAPGNLKPETLEKPKDEKLMDKEAVELIKQKDYINGLKILRDLHALRDSTLGPNHASTIATQARIADTLRRQKRYVEAVGTYGKVLRCITMARDREVNGQKSPTVRIIRKMASLVTKQPEKYDEIVKLFLTSLNSLKLSESPAALRGYHKIGRKFQKKGDLDKAILWYEKSLDGRKKVLGRRDPLVFETALDLGSVYLAKGLKGKAEGLAKEAFAGLRLKKGAEHKSTKKAARLLRKARKRVA